MRIEFRIVDVFAERPYEGNQLLVVPETPEGVGTETMQAVAREIGFVETTFVTAVRPDGYDVRIFTPVAEIPFAGHPTLGTAWVLASEGRIGAEVVQVCDAGEVPVSIDVAASHATMQQLSPEFGEPFEDRDAAAEAAGLDPGDLVEELPLLPASSGLLHVLVPVRDGSALRRATRRPSITEVCDRAGGAESLYLFSVGGDGDVMARMFDRSDTIGEDPATGSAAGPLGAYLAMHERAGMPGRMRVAQGELTGRPSWLDVEVGPDSGGWDVRVGGGVWRTGDGAFEV
jgi:trans-2,3-dihydro-3-hydroxyanthranilate isomerase